MNGSPTDAAIGLADKTEAEKQTNEGTTNATLIIRFLHAASFASIPTDGETKREKREKKRWKSERKMR